MSRGYITQLSETIERTHVRYNNRYGIAIAADIYTAKDLDKTKKYPALIVGAPVSVAAVDLYFRLHSVTPESRLLPQHQCMTYLMSEVCSETTMK